MSKKRKYTSFFIHDSDMRNDQKVELLMAAYDWNGYAFLNALYEDMSRNQPTYAVKYADAKFKTLYAKKFKIALDAYIKFVEFCIEVELFKLNDAGDLISESMLDRMSSRDESYQRRSEAGRQSIQKRWGKRANGESSQEIPAWFPLFVAQFRNEYPKGSKSFIGAETVEQELYKAVLNGTGEPNRDEAKRIIDGTRLYAKHIDSIDEGEEKFELVAATKWITNKGWTNNYEG